MEKVRGQAPGFSFNSTTLARCGLSLGKHATDAVLRLSHALLFLVLIGPAVSVYVPLAGTVRATVNVSLYELAMVPITVIALAALPGSKVPPIRLTVFLVPALLIALHSLYAVVAFPNLALGDLLKETVKYIGFFLFTFALALYLRLSIERPAFRRILTLAFVTVLVLMVIDWVRYAGLGSGVSGGSLPPHAALVLLYLYVATGDGPRRDAPETWVLPIAAVFVIALWGAKLFIGLALGVSLWGLLARGLTQDAEGRRKWLVVLFGALLLSAVGLVVWWELAAPYGRTLSRSISERLDLWTLAWELFQSHLPWGIGLGQYAAKAVNAAGMIDYYPHNTLLSALTELGLLGFVFLGFLLAAVVVSIGVGPHPSVWIALLIALGPMLLHDVLSFRSFQVLLAVGLAGLLHNDSTLSDGIRGR